jgi:arsenical pump membrane protein
MLAKSACITDFTWIKPYSNVARVPFVGWITTYAILRLVFRRQVRLTGEGKTQPLKAELSPPAKQFLALMAVALGSYPILSYAGGPVWSVAASTAAVGVVLCWYHRVASPKELGAAISWDILVFLFCVFLIVVGLRNVGVVDRITDLYASASNSAPRVVLVGISSAIGSAVLNNHPMAIINALAIRNLPDPTHQLMLAALIGGDLGPRLLPMGSLAGLLWLDSLRRQGVHVTASQFIRVGLMVTVPTLLLSLLVLIAMSAY